LKPINQIYICEFLRKVQRLATRALGRPKASAGAEQAGRCSELTSPLIGYARRS